MKCRENSPRCLTSEKEAFVNYAQCVPKLDLLHYEITDWTVLTEAGLLNKCSYLARALGVTKILKIKDDFGHTFKSHLDVQQIYLWGRSHKSYFGIILLQKLHFFTPISKLSKF
jgi:hypothetical protein